MTRDDLKAYTLQLLSAVGPGIEDQFFDDTFMLPALNRGQEEVQKWLVMGTGELYYLKIVETVTVQNQGDYIWPDDLLKLNSLELVLNGTGTNENKIPITPITLNQKFQYSSESGTPTNYYLKQDRFSLLPVPDTAGQTLRLYYTYKVADLSTGSQVPDIPEEYQKMISVYAAIEGKVKDESDPSNLMLMTSKFEDAMKKMAVDRQYQQPRMVVETEYSNPSGMW